VITSNTVIFGRILLPG